MSALTATNLSMKLAKKKTDNGGLVFDTCFDSKLSRHSCLSHSLHSRLLLAEFQGI